MNVGKRIKEAREKLGLSADDLASALGVDRSTVYRYEGSYIEKLPTKILEPLSKILKTTPSELMGWESEDDSVASDLKTILTIQNIDNAIRQQEANTYIIHGSEGKGTVITANIPKDKYLLVGEGDISELTKKEYSALKSVLDAMSSLDDE